jgi:hypothetical protein
MSANGSLREVMSSVKRLARWKQIASDLKCHCRFKRHNKKNPHNGGLFSTSFGNKTT